MQVAVYIFYELLIRLQELDPEIGEYSSYRKTSSGISLQTTAGHIEVPDDLISRQFNSPEFINSSELLSVLNTFKPHR
ncbi:hypothetical protein [Pedobacter duraquae]|uniref:Uncharacterized protein n=1 Tax=Pedobacter duraquae TaxID=425511 RepID=A0A4R6IQ22_9SPHI|nr:hypothetical protein [Pedobacter duraquae]TDO24287.1 hypothetical protein CLV32_0576 [Pedobacter duraquae]